MILEQNWVVSSFSFFLGSLLLLTILSSFTASYEDDGVPYTNIILDPPSIDFDRICVDLCLWAIQNKSLGLPTLKTLRSLGYTFTSHGLCTEAVEHGSLEMLQWLRGQDPPCPWDRWVCSAAARGGHLEMLRWLRSNGCPWNRYMCLESARNHPHVQEWIQNNPQ